MRCLPLLLLLLLPAAAFANERVTPPASAADLVRYRPAPWRLPSAVLRAGMRFDPETGEAIAPPSHDARGATRAALRRSAEASVTTRADGSRRARLGAAFRSWTVVRLGEDGRLETDCVDDIETATKRIDATRELPR